MTELPPCEEITLHGHRVYFRRGGQGPALLLIHGMAGDLDTWAPAFPDLMRDHYVIAPDLIGHGQSAKPRGDYSLGAHASGLRDLLEVLDVPRVTVIGQSLGGGIAMQFAYQYPERVERMVLVDSGGLGASVTPFLRAVTIPGAGPVLQIAASERVERVLRAAVSPVAGIGSHVVPKSAKRIARYFPRFRDPSARNAFINTARSVLDLRGQRINATDRLYLAEELPTLIVWGGRDRLIPVGHGHRAHSLIPGSRLEIFERAGHFPHEDEPERFAALIREFIATTKPAQLTTEALRRRVAQA